MNNTTSLERKHKDALSKMNQLRDEKEDILLTSQGEIDKLNIQLKDVTVENTRLKRQIQSMCFSF